MNSTKLKTHDWLILVLFVMLTLFGVLTFFFSPKDAEDAKIIIAAVVAAISMILSFKFGVHIATPNPSKETSD